MSKFLKLVGANTYTLRSVGTVRRNQVIEVDRDEDYERLLNKGEYADALQYIKDNSDEVALVKSPGAEKSWGLIPNPDLDPFS